MPTYDFKGAQVEINWAPQVPQSEREKIVGKMKSATRKPRAMATVDGREALEARGEEALAHRTIPLRQLRVYYHSMGGDRLFFETGPLSQDEYNSIVARCDTDDTEAYPNPRRNARGVLLPSQYPRFIAMEGPFSLTE